MTGLIKPELVVSKLRHFIVFFFLGRFILMREINQIEHEHTQRRIYYMLYITINIMILTLLELILQIHYIILYCIAAILKYYDYYIICSCV